MGILLAFACDGLGVGQASAGEDSSLTRGRAKAGGTLLVNRAALVVGLVARNTLLFRADIMLVGAVGILLAFAHTVNRRRIAAKARGTLLARRAALAVGLVPSKAVMVVADIMLVGAIGMLPACAISAIANAGGTLLARRAALVVGPVARSTFCNWSITDIMLVGAIGMLRASAPAVMANAGGTLAGDGATRVVRTQTDRNLG